jgi:hypothetical protein
MWERTGSYITLSSFAWVGRAPSFPPRPASHERSFVPTSMNVESGTRQVPRKVLVETHLQANSVRAWARRWAPCARGPIGQAIHHGGLLRRLLASARPGTESRVRAKRRSSPAPGAPDTNRRASWEKVGYIGGELAEEGDRGLDREGRGGVTSMMMPSLHPHPSGRAVDVRCARRAMGDGLAARARRSWWSRLALIPLPEDPRVSHVRDGCRWSRQRRARARFGCRHIIREVES